MSRTQLQHVRIVGSGLIGTSIGLALRAGGSDVTMVDTSQKAASLAQDLVGGKPSDSPVDLVVFALPISALGLVIESEYKANLNATFMDISSIKTKIKVEVEDSALPSSKFLPSHPMAGREVGGAQSARADLFIDRPWIYDGNGVESEALARGLALIEICGGHAIELESHEHDQAVALISHLPQITASLLAGALTNGEERALELAGSGLRDTTRIAASDPLLWREILSANSEALMPLLRSLSEELNSLIENLEDRDYVEGFIAKGNSGRARIPGKHGGAARKYTYVPVVIEDKPGQLAALFDECAKAEVNVEDISIEHSPEQFTGLITLALSESDAHVIFDHLIDAGWRVHSPR